MFAVDEKARMPVPMSYVLDKIDRRYGQPPGSHRDWDADDLIRALEFFRLEASVG